MNKPNPRYQVESLYSGIPGIYLAVSASTDAWICGLVEREGEDARRILFDDLSGRQSEHKKKFGHMNPKPWERQVLMPGETRGISFYPFLFFDASEGVVGEHGFNLDKDTILLSGPYESTDMAKQDIPSVWERYLSDPHAYHEEHNRRVRRGVLNNFRDLLAKVGDIEASNAIME